MSGVSVWWVVLVVLVATPAQAQGPESTLPSGDTVPTWIFLWTLGLGSAIITALVAALKVLWGRMNSKEQEIREYYEGTLEMPDKGVIPRVRAQYTAQFDELRTQHISERDELRTLGEAWRFKFEETEKGRRTDVERMRLEERESMKDGMLAMRDVAAALSENSVKMDSLIAGYGEEELEG